MSLVSNHCIQLDGNRFLYQVASRNKLMGFITSNGLDAYVVSVRCDGEEQVVVKEAVPLKVINAGFERGLMTPLRFDELVIEFSDPVLWCAFVEEER